MMNIALPLPLFFFDTYFVVQFLVMLQLLLLNIFQLILMINHRSKIAPLSSDFLPKKKEKF